MRASKIVFLLLRNLALRIQSWLALELRRAVLMQANKDCRLHFGAVVDPLSKLSHYNVLFNGARLLDSTIGDHSYLQIGATAHSCDIGKFCSIAMNAYLGLPQHRISGVSAHPVFTHANSPLVKRFSDRVHNIDEKRTIIGHDVWIGHGAMVMAGVSINTGCVVGAGAVVTRDVPCYAVVVGIPARILRFRFDDDLRQRLLASRWWDMPDSWMEANLELLADPFQLLATLEIYKSSL